MRTVYVLVSVLALATAAIQPNGPVYRSASVVNSSPIGKSLPNSNSPQQLPQPQHSAEERESQGFQPIESSNTGAVTSPVNPVAAPAPAPINPQTFKIVYYPSPGQVQASSYNQYPPQQVDYWTRYRVNDVLVAAASLGLLAAGGVILYPKFTGIKARALRELSEMKSEDASRMAKSVLHAIERIYEMNNAE